MKGNIEEIEQSVLRMLSLLGDNDGVTIKGYKAIRYKSGWQVATHGKEVTNILEAVKLVIYYSGHCGVWLSNGIFYVDCCKRVSTKKEALELGRTCNQISIYGWRSGVLAYC